MYHFLTQDDIDNVVDGFREAAMSAHDDTTRIANRLMMEVMPIYIAWIGKAQKDGIHPDDVMNASVACQCKMSVLIMRLATMNVSEREWLTDTVKVYEEMLAHDIREDAA